MEDLFEFWLIIIKNKKYRLVKKLIVFQQNIFGKLQFLVKDKECLKT